MTGAPAPPPADNGAVAAGLDYTTIALTLALAIPAGASAHESTTVAAERPRPRPGPRASLRAARRSPRRSFETAAPWKADPLLVSGASAYVNGEFIYQDFIYDDHGAQGISRDPADPRTGDDTFSAPNGTYTYPTDVERYRNNIADLVELRVKRAAATRRYFRLTFNSMTKPKAVATTIALGESDTPVELPFGANATRARRPVRRSFAAQARGAARRGRGDGQEAPRPGLEAPAPDHPLDPVEGLGSAGLDRPHGRGDRPVGQGGEDLPPAGGAGDRDAAGRRRPGSPSRRRSSTSPSASTSRCPVIADAAARSPTPPGGARTPRAQRSRPRTTSRRSSPRSTSGSSAPARPT